MTRPLWWDGVDTGAVPPAPLPASVDVAIVGGGYTGLWTAYYLLGLRPDLEVAVLEAEHVGFGASGRNGGWVSALYPVSTGVLAARHGRAPALAMADALRGAVDEVGRVCADEGVDAGFVKGGALVLARGNAQEARARAEVQGSHRWGGRTRWLDRAETLERLAASDQRGRAVRGATLTDDCARVHPYRLVEGLAGAVRRRGATIVEGCHVEDVSAAAGRHALRTSSGVLTARTIVRATEAWTARLPRLRRQIAPVYSLMVATEPLSAQEWEQVGLEDRSVFSDHGHVITYGQRTVDDRIAFGGRGAPYHLASRISPGLDEDEGVFAGLRAHLQALLPQVELRFSHAWGGPLGISRDWHPSVGYDGEAGVGWAGGYVGDGVAASNLAGRTLADLICDRRTTLTALPWVGHHSPRWEREPLRWLGVNAGLRAARLADAEEVRTGRPSRLTGTISRLTGG